MHNAHPRPVSADLLRSENWGPTLSVAVTAPASTRAPTARRAALGRHASGIRQDRTHLPPASSRPAGASTKRLLDIEEVLTWAFRHELPKRRDGDRGPRLGYAPVCPMFKHADLGTRVENFSREPGMPAALGDPHPDALAVEAAVTDLARFAEHRFSGSLGLLTYLPQDLDEHAAIAAAMEQVVGTVQVHARLGSRPTFASSPIPAALVGSNGKPIIYILRTEMRAGADGIMRPKLIEERTNAVAKDRYPKGAYCPLHWDDVGAILRERAAYAAWWAAIDLLAHELAGKLDTIAVLAPAAAQRPWAGDVDQAKPKRIIASLRRPTAPHRTPEAPRARRSLDRGRRASPVRRIDPATWSPQETQGAR